MQPSCRHRPRARTRLLVLVIGEAARAENQLLQGCHRETSPAMKQAGVYCFSDTWSCGTATTVSVPCTLSGMTREHFDKDESKARRNLLDIAQHAGVDVFWRDNDEGCKDMYVRVPNDDLTHATLAGLCDGSGCLDQVLIDDLPQRLKRMRSPALLVWHVKGSHGPSYYQRYPVAFATFQPACDTAELQTSTYEKVVNSYDNSILYTDQILGPGRGYAGGRPADRQRHVVSVRPRRLAGRERHLSARRIVGQHAVAAEAHPDVAVAVARLEATGGSQRIAPRHPAGAPREPGSSLQQRARRAHRRVPAVTGSAGAR